ncbi:MAG: SDR family NAD(P)-dependent oxidoreductase [Proteobacteria bacterium]|nr:SDR family NAD(P)-dependent oxidoreductase [Pseudomonadota bacterium]
MKKVIAVTGATGFIGQAICEQLIANNYSMRLLVRNPRKASSRIYSDAEIIRGDLADPDGLQRLVRGADAVIHCAGSVRGATQAEFHRVNVEGTRNLLHAIKACTTSQRLLFISSLAAREPQLSFYAASKHRAEQALKTEGSGIAWTVLRPPAVYGPGDRELLPVFRLMARGLALTPGLPDARFSMLYVDDLGSAVMAWLDSDCVTEEIFTIEDGRAKGYDWHDVGEIVGQLCKRKVRVVRAPSWLLDVPAWVNGRIGTLFGTAPMLTPEKLRELRHPDWVCDSTAFQQVIDWRPKVKLAEGLRATPDWPGHHPAAIGAE